MKTRGGLGILLALGLGLVPRIQEVLAGILEELPAFRMTNCGGARSERR